MTNTYQASIDGFKTYLDLDREESINLMKESVDFVKKAIDLELGNDYSKSRKTDNEFNIQSKLNTFAYVAFFK